jgi:hypothetical protein
MTLLSEQNPYAPPSASDEARPAATDVPPAPGPRGIGGWLLLPLSGLCLTPINTARDLLKLTEVMRDPELWAALTTPGQPSYRPLWKTLFLTQFIGSVLLLVFTLVVLVCFLRRSRQTPRLMVAWLLSRSVFIVLLAVLSSQVSGDTQGPGTAMLSAMIVLLWVVYFKSSERVKNTFVR